MTDKKAANVKVLIFPLAIIPLHDFRYIVIDKAGVDEYAAFAVLWDGTRVRIWQGSSESLQVFMIRTGEALGDSLRANSNISTEDEE